MNDDKHFDTNLSSILGKTECQQNLKYKLQQFYQSTLSSNMNYTYIVFIAELPNSS